MKIEKINNIQTIVLTIMLTSFIMKLYVDYNVVDKIDKVDDSLWTLVKSHEYQKHISGTDLSKQISEIKTQILENHQEAKNLSSKLFYLCIICSFIASWTATKKQKLTNGSN